MTIIAPFATPTALARQTFSVDDVLAGPQPDG
jgi:hypothetical protein